MPDRPGRPILVPVASYWTGTLGAALVTLAGISRRWALPLNIRGHVANPYFGLPLFVAIPIVFFSGPARGDPRIPSDRTGCGRLAKGEDGGNRPAYRGRTY